MGFALCLSENDVSKALRLDGERFGAKTIRINRSSSGRTDSRHDTRSDYRSSYTGGYSNNSYSNNYQNNYSNGGGDRDYRRWEINYWSHSTVLRLFCDF